MAGKLGQAQLHKRLFAQKRKRTYRQLGWVSTDQLIADIGAGFEFFSDNRGGRKIAPRGKAVA